MKKPDPEFAAILLVVTLIGLGVGLVFYAAHITGQEIRERGLKSIIIEIWEG